MGAAVASGPAFGDGPGGTTVVITAPSGIVAGDLLLAYLHSDNDGSAAAMTAPAGFTQISSSADTVVTIGGFGKIWTKPATGSEPGTYSFPASASSDNTGFMWRINGHNPGSVFAASPVWANPGAGATTSLIAPSVTLSASGLLVCGFTLEGMFGGSITPPGGMSGTSVSNSTGFVQTLPGIEAGKAVGATGTRTATASSSGSSNTQGYLTFSLAIADSTEQPSYVGWFLGPPTVGRPWRPAAPQWAGGELASVQVEPTTGASAVGLAATAQPRKVAVVIASAGVGLAAAGAARKQSGVSAAAAAGVTGNGGARKVTPTVARAATGPGSSCVARKGLATTSHARAGFATAGTAAKRATTSGRACTGVAPMAGVRKSGVAAGLAPVGVAASFTLGAPTPVAVAGRAWLGISASVTTIKVSTPTARAATGLAARLAAVKAARAAGAACIGVTPRTVAGKSVTTTGTASAGLAGTSTARKALTASVRSALAVVASAGGSRRTPVTGRALAALAAAGAAARRAPAGGRAFLGVAPDADLTPPKAPHLVPSVRRMANASPGRKGQTQVAPGNRTGPTIEGCV